MNWGSPHLLYALWLLPVYWLVLHFTDQRRRKGEADFADPAAWPVLQASLNPRARGQRHALRMLALLFMLLALARPQWGYRLEEVRSEGLDILVVLDTSKSMLAQDMRPDRITRATYGIRDLLNRLQGDRIGLLAFAGDSFLQCPLTIDYAAFRLALEDVFIGIIPRGGTAIEQALYQTISSFESSEEKADRVVILITDGDDHEGDPLRAVKQLKEENIRVFCVGVGSTDGELIPTVGDRGETAFLKNRRGEVVKSNLNEGVLQKLALETGGMYVRSAPGDFGLERIYEQGLSSLQRSTHESRTLKIFHDRFPLFLFPAFAFLCLECLIRERRPVTQEQLYREVRHEES